ncbi:MAG: response regulator transcription factor [Gammaproteobacteria bacterium]
MTAAAILLIEDDPQIARLVATQLREAGHEVEWVADGRAGLERFQAGAFYLLILDLMLPGIDGLDVCRRIRAYNHQTPILMLTARADKHDVVLGLEVGADDYLTKPFHEAELDARVQALLRRRMRGQASPPAEMPITCGPLTINPHKRKASVNDRAVMLTAKEFDLLLLFCRHPGRAFSRGDLLNAVWGAEFEGYDHTVNTHINRLRNKIETDANKPRFIQTVWGVGYRFAEPEEL